MMALRCMMFAVWLCGTAGSLAAQKPLRVTPVRSLVFGTLLPGVPSHILRTDPLNSGEFNLQGTKFGQVQITFALPASMAGPAGATMPISFGSSDAGFSPADNVGNQTAFDPRVPFVGTFDKDGNALVFLGGTTSPVTSQRAGSYTGTITLTVVYFP
jgi:hypothetical protein